MLIADYRWSFLLKKKISLILSIGVILSLFTHCDALVEKTASDIVLVNVSGGGASSSNTTHNTGSNDSAVDGQTFYSNQIAPKIASSCVACHAPIFENPVITAPLSITSYSSAKTLLLDGDAQDNNIFYNKVSNRSGHTGGNLCDGQVDGICELLKQWWIKETGKDVKAETLSGEVLAVSDMGRISGWAADPANSENRFDVEFFVNGDNVSGTFIGSTYANQVGFNGGVPGNHAFSYTIPEQYRNGTNYLLNAYLVSGSSYIRLAGTPRNFTLYAPRPEAVNYFQTTVMPRLNDRCIQCHVVSHDQFFNSLASPKPNNGGSVINNEMIRMPLGAFDGKSHPGGNICGNQDSSPCREIQEWWRRQFQ